MAAPLLFFSCSAQVDDEYGTALCELYTSNELEYFSEIAFGTEFTSSTMANKVTNNNNTFSKRWYENVRIKVSGAPSKSDIQTLNSIIDELNTIIDPIEIYIVSEREEFNTEIKFIHNERKSKVVEGDFEYEITYYGSQGKTYSHQGRITKSEIIISDTAVNPEIRAHEIREELTQSLGLYRDSDRYLNSIFNDTRNNRVTEYAEIDVKLIEILYNQKLPPMLKKEDFLEAVSDCIN